MQQSNILIFEIDRASQMEISNCLETHGYQVNLARSPADFWRRLNSRCVDAVVLNLGGFGCDSLLCLRRVRTQTSVPLIAIDSSRDKLDRILALELGADDYLSHPIVARELLARLRSIERRSAVARSGEEQEFTFCGWHFCPDQRRLFRVDGTALTLSAMESALLHALVSAPGKLMSRDRLLSRAHPDVGEAGERSIDVMIARLRRKLGSERNLIVTVRGGGYRFGTQVEAEGSARNERRQRPRVLPATARAPSWTE